jgi:hypothetical protein
MTFDCQSQSNPLYWIATGLNYPNQIYPSNNNPLKLTHAKLLKCGKTIPRFWVQPQVPRHGRQLDQSSANSFLSEYIAN